MAIVLGAWCPAWLTVVLKVSLTFFGFFFVPAFGSRSPSASPRVRSLGDGDAARRARRTRRTASAVISLRKWLSSSEKGVGDRLGPATANTTP